jgi:hypothetical protein
MQVCKTCTYVYEGPRRTHCEICSTPYPENSLNQTRTSASVEEQKYPESDVATVGGISGQEVGQPNTTESPSISSPTLSSTSASPSPPDETLLSAENKRWIERIGCQFVLCFPIVDKDLHTVFNTPPERLFSRLRKEPFKLTPTRCTLFAHHIGIRKTEIKFEEYNRKRAIIEEQNREYQKSVERDLLKNVSGGYSDCVLPKNNSSGSSGPPEPPEPTELTVKADPTSERQKRADAFEKLLKSKSKSK